MFTESDYSRGTRLVQILATVLLLTLGCVAAASAAERIIVLEFALDDDTLVPNVDEEQARVASIADFVRTSLETLGHHAPVVATPAELKPLIANEYLIRFPQAAVDIARQNGVRWIAIGKLRKFSFMESWLRLYLIDSNSGQIVGHAEAEVRGHMTDSRMTQRTANSLAEQIDRFMVELRDG